MADNNHGYTNYDHRKDLEAFELGSSFRARLEVARLQGEKLVEEYRNNVASALVGAGITLIPSDTLKDHQYVVSRGVYEAAKRMFGEKK